jgi:hypothetical protein
MIPETGTSSELKAAVFGCGVLPEVGDVYEARSRSGIGYWRILSIDFGLVHWINFVDEDVEKNGTYIPCYITFKEWWMFIDDGSLVLHATRIRQTH